MNDAALTAFREMAEMMTAGRPAQDWVVCRKTDEGATVIIAFGYSEERAKRAATYYRGGFAEHESVTLARVLPTTR